ncbi:zinc metalloproteinase nas-14-like [Choristoneura fumiferana]|uniref:zinc metalloproteinase nas-14-like n=1 Tax=Choristoneura fumiferana TaxID=7141 RepID=UPI003D15688E
MTMLRFVVLLCLLGLALSGPPVGKSREEIDAFQKYLESGRTNNGVRLEDRMAENPNGKAWENSGKYQGDIILDEDQVQAMVNDFSAGRNAYTWPNTKWPQNTVVYEIAAGHFTTAAQNAIIAGIRDIERNTCIRFRLRQWYDTNYVRVTNFNDGCYAHVGFWASRGIHTLNLTWPSCSLHTTIVHEWLHIIGFLHMQSTHNRDDYVRILWENIWPGMEHNFDKYPANLVSNLGLPYDYASTMHYGGYGFSINGRPTMVALWDTAGVMGQQQWISAWDWQRVNRHYNCAGAWNRDAPVDDSAPGQLM